MLGRLYVGAMLRRQCRRRRRWRANGAVAAANGRDNLNANDDGDEWATMHDATNECWRPDLGDDDGGDGGAMTMRRWVYARRWRVMSGAWVSAMAMAMLVLQRPRPRRRVVAAMGGVDERAMAMAVTMAAAGGQWPWFNK